MSLIGTFSHATHALSHAAHDILHGAKKGLDKIDGEAHKLSDEAAHELTALRNTIEHLESHLNLTEILNKTLHSTIHEIEDIGEGFAHDVEDIAKDVWKNIHELYEHMLDLFKKLKDAGLLLILKDIILDFKDAVREALQAITKLFDKAEDIVKLIDLERFARVFEGISSVWEDLLHTAEQVPHLLEEAVSLSDSTKNWLEGAAEKGAEKAHSDQESWVQSLHEFSHAFESMVKDRALPIATDVMHLSLTELEDVIQLIPSHLWKKVYHALHLEAVYNFGQHAISAMKSAQFRRDMAIALAACKSLIHWIKTIPQVIGLDADFDLIDFIKAKVGAGDASGVAEGGGDGDTGGGFNVKFNAVSGMGALSSILSAILNLFTAGAQLVTDEIKA